MRSVSSVSVESCVSDIVAELPPSFTVPLDQVLFTPLSTFVPAANFSWTRLC